MKRKLNRIKREIKKEIRIEIAAAKQVIPILGGAIVLCAGGYAWISFLCGIMH